MKYVVADPHFGHFNIIRYCNRQFKTSEEMDKFEINSFNSVIKDDKDELIIVGDFCLKSAQHHNYYASILKKLRGRKILIIGNHDELRPRFYLEVGFYAIHTSLEIKINGIDTVLVHDPCFSCTDRSKLFLCGHVHDLFHVQKNVINVGVDVNNYIPQSEEQIYELYNEKVKGWIENQN